MADNEEEGYEDHRFEKEVDRNLHCPICLNVLKDPKQCLHNQHLFCSPCIQRYLGEHSQTCPTCREALTIETLVRPPRILTDLLSTLKIRCDFAARGCRELVELEFLKRHAAGCGYSPTKCDNHGCPEIISRNDKDNHEFLVCGFRKVKCHDCGEEVLFKIFEAHGCVLKKEMVEVKMSLNQMKTEVKDELGMMRQQMQCNQEEMMQEVRGMTAGMMAEMKELVNNATKQANEAKEETKYIKQIIDGPHHFNTRENIVVAGGYDGKSCLNSVERFSCITGTWEPLQSMKQRRGGASSFVYQGQMFVAGGKSDDVNRLDSLERLNIDEEPGQWLDIDAKLPVQVSGHANVVDENRLIVTGGITEKGVSDGISEILLTPPYSSKLLCKMPQPRVCHCSQLFHDKIMIFGGKKTLDNKESCDSVFVYNITSNEICEEKAPLPFAVNSMASVSLNDNVFLMGGVDKNDDVLNTVVKYDVKTGKSELLPPMKYRRDGCVAVVTGNVVVVMGGWNKEQGQLNSVEYFSLDRYAWKELPPMIEKRSYPTAAVKHVV